MTSLAKTLEEAKDLPEALESSISIPFETARHARIVADSLRVDLAHETGRIKSGIVKTIEDHENELVIRFKTANTKNLRVNINSYLEHILLLIQVIQQFDVPVIVPELPQGQDDNKRSESHEDVGRGQ